MIVGIDFASVDGNKLEDWDAAKEKTSVGFAMHRATYGVWRDPAFASDWVRMKSSGLTRGAYLFLRYNRPHAAVSEPEVQAQAFIDAVGDLDPTDFPPIIDIEFEGNGRGDTGMSIAGALDWIGRAWAALKARYNVAPMLYTSARVWRDDLGNVDATGFFESPMWLAKPWPWAERTPAQLDAAFFADGTHDPKVPPTWGSQWFIHQYQGDALEFPGFSSTVDLNRFRLTTSGAKGDHVSWIQRRLGLETTGIFDSETLDGVVTFQSKNGLEADGEVGPRTFARLCWA